MHSFKTAQLSLTVERSVYRRCAAVTSKALIPGSFAGFGCGRGREISGPREAVLRGFLVSLGVAVGFSVVQ